MPRKRRVVVDQAAIERWWDEFAASVEQAEWPRAEHLLRSLAAMPGVSRGEVEYARAVAAWERDGPTAARDILVGAVQLEPGHADARHALALVADELGDLGERDRQFMAVLRLDTAADAELGLESAADRRFITEVASDVLDGLPDEFRARLSNVPLVLESRPAIALVGAGFDPRSLGLFEGNTDGEREALALAPTRIVLYAANLLAAFGHDDEALEDEIETTILHEVAHFFGLDEDQVAELGLE